MQGLRQLPEAYRIAIAEKLADEIDLDLKWDRFAKSTLANENRMKPALRDVFRRQKEDVLRRMQNNPIPEEERAWLAWEPQTTEDMIWKEANAKAPSDIYNPWLFSGDEWNVILEEAARPFIERAMFEGAEDAILDINNDLNVTLPIAFDVRDPNIQTIVNNKLLKFAPDVNDETKRLLKKEEALKLGESIPLIEKRVAKVFGFTSKVRTNRIARTEIIGATNAGSFEAMINSGVVATKKWLNSRDAKVRETHQINEVIPVRDRFSNGLRFPGDWTGAVGEIVNCRCTMVAEDYLI